MDDVHSVPKPRSELDIIKEFAQKYDDASALATTDVKPMGEPVQTTMVWNLPSMRVKREVLRKLLKEGKTDEAVQMFEEARRMLLDFNTTDLDDD